MDDSDHVRFSGTKYEKRNNIIIVITINVVKSCFFVFPRGHTPRPPDTHPHVSGEAVPPTRSLGRERALPCQQPQAEPEGARGERARRCSLPDLPRGDQLLSEGPCTQRASRKRDLLWRSLSFSLSLALTLAALMALV